MTAQLTPCPACERHVRMEEIACPYCERLLASGWAMLRPTALPARERDDDRRREHGAPARVRR